MTDPDQLADRLNTLDEITQQLDETMTGVDREWAGAREEFKQLKRTLRRGLVFFVAAIVFVMVVVMVLAPVLL